MDQEHASVQIDENDETLTAIYNDKMVTVNELPAIIAKVDALGLPASVVKVIWVPQGITGNLGESGAEVFGYNLGSERRKDIVLLFLDGLAKTRLSANERAQTLSHEVGHALRGSSHREDGYRKLLPRYHLMAKYGGNAVRDDSPDSSGKHWYVRESETIKVPPAEPVTP